MLTPQGLGNHVDHQQVTGATIACFPADRTAFYRDTPYAVRQPDAQPLPIVPATSPRTIGIAPSLDRKIAAAQAYTSQIGFQFGGPAPLGLALRRFAGEEGGGQPAERFCGRALTDLLS